LGRNDINAENSHNTVKDWQRIIPGVIISLVALGIVLYFVDFHKFVEAFKQADYRLIGMGVVLILVWLLIRGAFWRTLLQEHATYPDVFFTVCEGYLINNFLPFRLGEVARAFLLGRKAKLDFFQVFSTIVIERALDLVMAASIFLGALPFVVGATWARSAAALTGGLVLGGLVVLYLLARNQAWTLKAFDKLSSRLPILQKLGGKALSAFLAGLVILTDSRRFVIALGWLVLNYAFSALQYFVLMKAFFPRATLLWSVFGLGVVALGVALPSSPGAVGVFEGSLTFALAAFQADSSTATAFAVMAHVIGYLVTGILGTYALAREGETLLGLYRSVRNLLLRQKSLEN